MVRAKNHIQKAEEIQSQLVIPAKDSVVVIIAYPEQTTKESEQQKQKRQKAMWFGIGAALGFAIRLLIP